MPKPDEKEGEGFKFETIKELPVTSVKDQNGNKYYKIKNSWGTERGPYKGYWYCSEQYLRKYTIFFTLHKDALSKSMKKSLNL